jgi:hypothetical protein
MIGRMLLHVAFTPARRSCGRKPMTAKEIAWSIAAFALFFAILGALNHGYTAPTTAPMHGWYVGQDGNYYPDGFPIDRTLPKAQPTVAAKPATTPQGSATNWTAVATAFGMIFGGIVILFMLGLMMNPKPLPGATATAAPIVTPTTRRRPPPPSDPWRPYGQPFDL